MICGLLFCVVYIATSPAVAYRRLRVRARTEESSVSLAYLMELHRFHEDWLQGLQLRNMSGVEDIPVIGVIF